MHCLLHLLCIFLMWGVFHLTWICTFLGTYRTELPDWIWYLHNTAQCTLVCYFLSLWWHYTCRSRNITFINVYIVSSFNLVSCRASTKIKWNPISTWSLFFFTWICFIHFGMYFDNDMFFFVFFTFILEWFFLVSWSSIFLLLLWFSYVLYLISYWTL